MENIIYGVNLNEEVTPLMVRDAISQCFYEAHCQDTGFEEETGDGNDKERNQLYCQQIVKKSFEDSQANFENPTKEDILKAVEELKEFSKNFRDPSIIQKHFVEILTLIDKLK